MGYGDYIMLSGIVRDFRKKFPGTAITARAAERSGYFQAIFQGNPYITRAADVDGTKPVLDLPPVQFGARDEAEGRIRWSPGFTAIPGNLYFSDAEMQWAIRVTEEIRMRSGSDLLVLANPYAKQGVVVDGRQFDYEHHVNKEWGAAGYEELVRALRGTAAFLQPVAESDTRPVLAGMHAVVSNYREAAALLTQCDAYLGCEGGLHHAAAALDRRGVVIFGGWLSPKVTGYPIHDNVYRGDLEDACGSLRVCPHCREIMDGIRVDEIALRLEAMLGVRA